MAPASSIPEPEKFQIDQYLMRGGRVAFLLNRVSADLQSGTGRPLDVNLDDMLESYGLRLNNDLIRDIQCANISIVQQQYGFSMRSQVPFPYLPLATTMHPENTMVKDLQGIVFFFVSSVDTTALAAKNLTGDILVRSSDQSGRQTGSFAFDPLQQFTRAEFTESGIPLAALVTGSFQSAYSGKPVPVDTSVSAPPPVSQPLTNSPETRVVLVGDGDFALDQYMSNRENLSFLANMVDYLVDDAGLISIRSKEVSMPPLEQVSDGTKKMLKYGNLALPPLLVLGYGLMRWRMRNARRKAMEVQ
jgi:gliding-associated putative ABC transporter substrate-binding component GldG